MTKSKSLTAAYFFLGAFALVSQTMILREFFVVVYGNEFIFGVILANWLIGIFFGASTGSAIADRAKNNLKIFSLAILLLVIIFPLSITAIRFLYTISGTHLGTYVSFSNAAIYSALFIIPVSFFIGFAFPIAARIHSGADANAGIPTQYRVQKISTIYIVEALGSLLSGVIYTFALVGRINPYFIAGLFTLPLLISCAIVLKKTRLKTIRVISVLLLIINLLALIPFINKKIENFTTAKRWRSFSQLPLDYSIDSKYQNIIVSKLVGQYNLYLNTMLASVFPNEEDNMILAAHLTAQHPAPATNQRMNILVIGDAISGLAGYLLRFDVEKLISVEIDAKVVETILRFLPTTEKEMMQKYQADGRFEIKISDGRKYVKGVIEGREPESKAPYFDIVYINVPEPSTLLLNRFYTMEFFRDLALILRKNGVMALKITASEDYMQGIVSDYTASIYNTVKSVFPYVTAAPGTQAFIFAAASPGVVTDDPNILEKRHSQTGVFSSNFGLIFHSLYPPEKTAAVNNALRSHARYHLNTDENPKAGFYFNKIIGWYGKSRVTDALEFFEKVKAKDIIIIALVLFFSRLAYISLRRKTPHTRRCVSKFHTLIAVFCGGMVGLSLELVIIYTYQYNFGSVYHIIGFIIAIFMFGLPMGALTSTALISRGKLNREQGGIKAIIIVQAIIGAIAFLFPFIVRMFVRFSFLEQLVIFSFTILTGFAVGLLFPLSTHLYFAAGCEKTGRTAGIISAFDHIGAAVGAFFIGSLFLPVMGLAQVCHLLALFPLLSLLLLLTNFLFDRRILNDLTIKGGT